MVVYELAPGAKAPGVALQAQAEKDGLFAGSPWGPVQFAYHVGDGIWFVSTASHGGMFLRRDLADLVPVEVVQASWLGDAQWWEEDADAIWVAVIFPDRVTLKWRDDANKLVAKVHRDGSSYYKPDAMAAALNARCAISRMVAA